MRSLLPLVVASLLAISTAQAARCAFRVHLGANARDGSVFSQPVRMPDGHDVFIEKTPWLSERDVVAFYPYRAPDGTFGALLQLDDHGRTILDTLSMEHRGEMLFIFLDGRALTEMRIDRRVSDGKIFLPSGLSQADLKLMGKSWKVIGRKK